LILAGLAAGLRSIDVSPNLISTITDAVLDEVAEWHLQAMSAPRYLQVKLADVTTPA
jgi:transposase-like protein